MWARPRDGTGEKRRYKNCCDQKESCRKQIVPTLEHIRRHLVTTKMHILVREQLQCFRKYDNLHIVITFSHTFIDKCKFRLSDYQFITIQKKRTLDITAIVEDQLCKITYRKHPSCLIENTCSRLFMRRFFLRNRIFHIRA